MKVAFASNFLNHHQLPLCLEFYRKLGSDFCFIATEQLPSERSSLGYADMSMGYSWAINSYENDNVKREAARRVSESDVFIMGDAPESLITPRLDAGGLSFRYNERLFKRGYWELLDLRVASALYRRHTAHRHSNTYLLSAGAYAAKDFRLVGAYHGRAFKWGYFPAFRQHDLDALFSRKQRTLPELLWVGRLLDWKHPDHAVNIARLLRDAGYEFVFNIVGVGPMEDFLSSRVRALSLEQNVRFLHALSPDQVRDRMESANILLMTSDRGEGWGAVVNEGMNSGCAVVASHLAGSAPYLIQHGRSGMIYHSGDWVEATNLVKLLLDDLALAREIGSSAYEAIATEWNAGTAATRLLRLSDSLLGGSRCWYRSGPCSVA